MTFTSEAVSRFVSKVTLSFLLGRHCFGDEFIPVEEGGPLAIQLSRHSPKLITHSRSPRYYRLSWYFHSAPRRSFAALLGPWGGWVWEAFSSGAPRRTGGEESRTTTVLRWMGGASCRG